VARPRIGVAVSGGLTAPEIVDCVRRAEDLGYESAWVAEGHGGDQFAILAACATATTRIRLGTSIAGRSIADCRIDRTRAVSSQHAARAGFAA